MSLEVTYRKGKPVAAYLYLPRRDDDRTARSERRAAGLIVDFAVDDRPIGIEIIAPSNLDWSTINGLLESLNLPPATPADLRPLKFAG